MVSHHWVGPADHRLPGHLLIGLSLLVGLMVGAGAAFGMTLMLIDWTAHMDFGFIENTNNFLINDHPGYAGLLVYLIAKHDGHLFGLDRIAERLSFVRATSLHYAQATLLAACAVLCLVLPAGAQMSPAARRGLTFVTTHCSGCHSVDKVTPSPLVVAPPFRTLHERYPVEDLAESLAEGIMVGHPSMPEFQLDPGQVGDVITYLKTLE